MDKKKAYNLVNEYKAQLGLPGVNDFVKMSLTDIEKVLKTFEWPVEYMEAMIDAGAHVGYQLNTVTRNPDGTYNGYNNWTIRVEMLKKSIKYRRSDEGMKDILKAATPAACRTEKDDKRSKMNTATIRLDSGDTSREGKEQTKLNIQRMEYIKLLEKSISKGGAVRDAYDEARAEYNRDVENLPTNEESAKNAMMEKRKNKIPTLLLSWLIMLIYAIVKSLEGFCDSLIITHKMDEDVQYTKFGSEHGFFGRMVFPFIVALFFAWLEYAKVELTGADPLAAAIEEFIIVFPVLILVKTILYLPFMYLTKFMGMIAENASWCFASRDKNDFQLGKVSHSLDRIKALEKIIQEREELIENLKDAIKNNKPYTLYDAQYKVTKGYTVKDVKKETKEDFLFI